MQRLRPLVGLVVLVGLTSCTITTSTSSSTTAPTTVAAPSATSRGTTTEPADDEDEGTSQAEPVELGRWEGLTASGPLEDALMDSGRAMCAYTRTGYAWELRLPDDSDLGSIGIEFPSYEIGSEATVEITTPGNKDTAAEGSALVEHEIVDEGAVSFSFGLSYRTSDGETGEMTGHGACEQEEPPTR